MTRRTRITRHRSRRALLAVPLLAVLLAACPSSKPKPSPVDEVVDSNVAARGGKEKIQALRSIRETGTVTASDGRVAHVVREIKRPGLFRLQFSYQGTTSVFAHDGKTAWQVAPMFGEFEPKALPPEDAGAAALDQRDIEGALVDWQAKGNQVKLLGRKPLAGGEAFELEVVVAGDGTRHDYVDVASHQIVRSVVTRTIGGEAVELENDFSDFREEGGIVFPHLIETRGKGRPQTLKIVIEKIELDPELDDQRFKMPE
jgi:outer membrane lipoprotein-sorting protein